MQRRTQLMGVTKKMRVVSNDASVIYWSKFGDGMEGLECFNAGWQNTTQAKKRYEKMSYRLSK